MKQKILTGAVLGGLILAQGAAAAAGLTPEQQKIVDQSMPSMAGAQLERARDYMERERVARQIEEDRARAKSEVENKQQQAAQESAEGVSFTLQHIVTDPSTVLTDAELDALSKDYLQREVKVSDLYALVGKINDLYTSKGYLTCRAFLEKQTIKDGTVKITLVEGTTGELTVQNNKATKSRYITNRLHLVPGQVPNLQQVNRDLLRFNATNDVQLRVVMQEGAAKGTTDYVIEAYEPKQQNWTIFTDNAGNYSTGDWRQGLFYNVRSLSGNRDALSLGVIRSQGTQAFSSSYSRPVGRSGAKLNFSYTANGVHQVKNDEVYQVRGHAQAYNVTYIQPWVVTRRLRSEVSVELGRQDSSSDFSTAGQRFNIADDTIHDLTLGFAMTNYGNSHLFYQKHSYTRGYAKSTPAATKSSSQHYGYYKFAGLYRKDYTHGQGISAQANLQWAGTDGMVSARQFYLGGMYNVRGYKENLLGADSGFNLNLEYSVPLSPNRQTHAFVFFDYGRLFGETAQSSFDDYILASYGLGVRAVWKQNYSANLTVGMPLHRELQVGKAASARVNFLLSAQF